MSTQTTVNDKRFDTAYKKCPGCGDWMHRNGWARHVGACDQADSDVLGEVFSREY